MGWATRAAVVISGLASLVVPHNACSQGAYKALTATEERNLKPGDSFRECSECPAMVVIPPGRFLMGSPDNEAKRDGDEGPQQEVTIPAPFAAGAFEVTFEEWDGCLAAGGCNGYRPSDVGWGRGKRPVVIVSWEDAKAYVAWLSNKTSRAYRLLSEAEWEYAARGGTTTMFSWGQTITTEQANYDGALPLPGTAPGEVRHQTVPVDSFAPNRFGLYNVHGNVWEWVEDCYQRRYSDLPEATRRTGASHDAAQCETRVFRGGSWGDGAHVLRAANRGRYEPFIRNTNGGFRVARTLSR